MVKRYTPVDQWGQETPKCMDPDENGSYVRASDYDALAARLADSEKRADELAVRMHWYFEQEANLIATRARLAEAERQRGVLLDALLEQRRQMQHPSLPDDFAVTMIRMIDAARATVSASAGSRTCPTCNGTGLHPGPYSCIFCHGTGVTVSAGEKP